MKISTNELRKIIREVLDIEDPEMIESIKFGKEIKRIFQENNGPGNFKKAKKVHWTRSENDAIKFLKGQISGEVSATANLPGKVYLGGWAPIGLMLDGEVTLFHEFDAFTGSSETWFASGKTLEKFPVLDLFADFSDENDIEAILDDNASPQEKYRAFQSLGFNSDISGELPKNNEVLIKDFVVKKVYIPKKMIDQTLSLQELANSSNIPVFIYGK